MAVLNELNVRNAMAVDATNSVQISESAENIIKAALAKVFWEWYAAHEHDSIAHLNLLFIHKTVRVSDVRAVFVMLFGEPNA